MLGDSVLRFADYELDPAAGELHRRGSKIKLAPQPLRLLALLANSPGQVLTREVLQRQLWNGTFVDFEHGLNFCVREVRKALREDARRPRFIETLPRRGYRFAAPVSRSERNGDSRQGDQTGLQSQNAAAQCAEGRRLFRQMGNGALEQAARHFQCAVEANPDYAMAHSGLGATYAMRYIRDANPEHLHLAKTHLERACVLDSELPEPYPWLCYVCMRYGEVERALETGRRAVNLLPDMVQAQYFLGLAYFVSCEGGAQNYSAAVHHLLQAAKFGPHWPATWFVLASICLLNNESVLAEDFACRLLECKVESKTVKFIGGENLLGSLYLRRGDFGSAHEYFQQSLTTLADSDHTYAEAMKAWSACGLGDVALRDSRPDTALVHYRKAWQIVQEFPTIMAHERHSARALASLATAYAAVQQQDRAKKLLAQAMPLLQRSCRFETSAAGANLAELHYTFAVAYLRLGNYDRGIEHLERAFNAGWHNADWLELDPELSELRSHPSLVALLVKIRSLPPVFERQPIDR